MRRDDYRVEDIRLPELTNRTRVDLRGISKGITRQGTISVRGWVEVANKDAELHTQVRNVDLAHFEPYPLTKIKSGIDSGSFNLDLRSRVKKNVVTASGTLTVIALKFKKSDNPAANHDITAPASGLGAVPALKFARWMRCPESSSSRKVSRIARRSRFRNPHMGLKWFSFAVWSRLARPS